MAKIKVDGVEVEGKVSTTMASRIEDGVNVLEITGALKTEKYFEEINKIETNRFDIEGVYVYAEHYGTEENEIVYEFLAEDIKVRQ